MLPQIAGIQAFLLLHPSCPVLVGLIVCLLSFPNQGSTILPTHQPALNPDPNPTTPSTTTATTHLAAAPAATSPPALKYPDPSRILTASRFCTATAHSTPLPTLRPTFHPSLSLSASSYFHTTIRIGKSFMHELTISAVVMPLAVARGVVSGAAVSEVGGC